MLNFRSLISQLCGIFPYVCLQFANGSFVGYQIILIAELHKKDSEIPTTLDQLTWFASLDFLKLASSLLTGLLMHRLGGRLVALASALLFITSLLMYYYSTTTALIFVGRILSSLLMAYPLSMPHISEISEPRLRSPFLAIAELAVTVGTFFSLLLGSLMYWRTVALVNLVFPIVAAVTMLTTPNSPTWLVSRGRLDDAEKALCWLRGWAKPEQIQTEFRALVDNIEKSNTSNNQTIDIEAITWKTRSKNFLQLLLQRSFYVPFTSVFFICLLYYSGGQTTKDSYSAVIFEKLNSPIKESVATAIMGAMGVVGNLIILFFVHRTGKRNLVLVSVVIMSLCDATVAIIGFLKLKDEYLWIPPIAVIISKFASSSGIAGILYMIAGEIFPTSVRYIGASMVVALKMILQSMMNKVFLYAVNAVTLPGVFLFFAFANLGALIVNYFLFPETEGRSLEEIEDHFKGGKNARERER